MIWFPLNVPFGVTKKNFDVPLQIFIMKKIPDEPPKLYVEVLEGCAVNPSNKDVNTDTRQIITNTLKNWNIDSNIDNVMDEILKSFSYCFPIYKRSFIKSEKNDNKFIGALSTLEEKSNYSNNSKYKYNKSFEKKESEEFPKENNNNPDNKKMNEERDKMLNKLTNLK